MLTPDEVVQKFVKVWAAGDLAATMSLVAEDARYTLHLSDELLFLGGETGGARQHRDRRCGRFPRASSTISCSARWPSLRVETSFASEWRFMYRHIASAARS